MNAPARHSWGPASAGAAPGTTLDRHILERQRKIPEARGDFTALFQQIALAGKIINARVRQAGLIDVLGATGTMNVQGERVQKLDAIANSVMIRSLEACGQLCLMASEEDEDVIPIPARYPTGKYVALFDPLDGSSNIDVGVAIGTVFAVHRRRSEGRDGTLEDCLQSGRSLVAAGYILYGSSTMLVYSTGDGVHGFTLDSSIGEFYLSHENIRMPARGSVYSINEGNAPRWSPGVRAWVKYLKDLDPASGRPYGQRYVGSMVADVHRTLLKGGVFAYPADEKAPEGKLRLLYEANPMAFLVEAAGGRASDGARELATLEPTTLHQRVPVLLGSRDDVALAEEFFSGARTA